jgi:cell division protein FtsW (lipid II flippase)
MKGPIWLSWVVVGLLAVLSIVLLMEKGSFMIAGYNTASKQEKEKYDVKKLCRVLGAGLGIITIISVIYLYYEYNLPSCIQWLIPWGYFIVIVAIIVLGNTICKKNKECHLKFDE